MPIDGRHTTLWIDLGTPSVPQWIIVGEGTDLGESGSRSVTRVAHKDSSDTIPIAGSLERSFTFSGFGFDSDAGQAAAALAFENNIEYRWRTYKYKQPARQFRGLVTSIDRTSPVGQPETFNFTVEPTETPYPV